MSLVTRHSSLLFLCLLLAGCSEFERAAYRTLAVTKAEYETTQSRVAEAAAHGLLSEDQWNRFSAEGHRFIAAHNAAVDAFELWSHVKSPPNQARVAALLEILPRLVRELNSLAESFEKQPQPGVRSQESEVRMKTIRLSSRASFVPSKAEGQATRDLLFIIPIPKVSNGDNSSSDSCLLTPSLRPCL